MKTEPEKQNSRNAPLTQEQKAELLRRRNARLAAQRGERPPQPLTPEQRKRMETAQKQRAAQQEKQRVAELRAVKQQQKERQKREKLRTKNQPTTSNGVLPGTPRMSHSAARRARRKRAIFAVVVLLSFIAAGFALSVTVLFKLDSYRVDGTCGYSEAQLIEAFGHPIGENVFRFKLSETQEQMSRKLPYLETIKVRRRLPGTIVFIVEPAVESAYLEQEDGSAILLSETLKVLNTSSAPASALLRITGFVAKEPVAGVPLSSGDAEKDALLKLVYSSVKTSGIQNITAIDVADEYEITASFADRITIRLGTSSQMEYKLSVAKKALETGLADGTFTEVSGGVLDASNAGTAYYHP